MLLPYYDIFISYAVEDRDTVEEIATALCSRGLKIYYTKEHLQGGVGIYDTVNYGLNNSKFGIALISPHYWSKWTHGELFELQKRKKQLIPVLHAISMEYAISLYPELSDTFILETKHGTAKLTDEICRRVRKRNPLARRTASILKNLRTRKKKLIRLGGWSSLAALLFLLIPQIIPAPVPEKELETAINKRVLAQEAEISKTLQEKLMQSGARKSNYAEVLASQQLCFFSEARHTRNIVSFSNGEERINSLAGIKNAGVIEPLSKLELPFGLKNYRIYILSGLRSNDSCVLEFMIVNQEASAYKIEKREQKEGILSVEVTYSEPLRYAEVKMHFDSSKGTLTRVTKILGYKKTETYLFIQKNNEWICTALR